MIKNNAYYETDIIEFGIANEKDYKSRFNYFQRCYAAVRIVDRHEVRDNIIKISCDGGGEILFEIKCKIKGKTILWFIGTMGRG